MKEVKSSLKRNYVMVAVSRQVMVIISRIAQKEENAETAMENIQQHCMVCN